MKADPHPLGTSVDTIAAPITAHGRAGVAVVRISGPLAAPVLAQISPRASLITAQPRTLVMTPFLEGQITGADHVLDYGLAAYFPAPNSFTGEDCVELNLHGSPYLVTRLMSILAELGVRSAKPGEFSERAFLNGKLDLSQAEAIADLIAADTEIQARVAREQLEGRLSKALSDLGEPLRNLLAEIEAHIDFPDEDIEPLTYSEWTSALRAIEGQIEAYLRSFAYGRLCREGALVVLAGVPNAGKSSLLNRLLGEDRAIVTAVPGTTRDSIEEPASLGGLRVRFCDTAGLATEHRTPDEVEQLGIERSWKKLTQADLVLYVFDISTGLDAELDIVEGVRQSARKVMLVANKADLVSNAGAGNLPSGSDARLVSAQNGEGIAQLADAIVAELLGDDAQSDALLITNQRHFEALRGADRALKDALVALQSSTPAEFVAVDLRAALGALEEIIGSTPTEDILGRIFSKFCIGK
ncbi:MAG: tRNA uridine-5-carboxymethylaminomethyl(34) synthesis GTPase MnmE [Bdellovibrionota bacterium]